MLLRVYLHELHHFTYHQQQKDFLEVINYNRAQAVDVFWGATSFKLEGRLLELYLS